VGFGLMTLFMAAIVLTSVAGFRNIDGHLDEIVNKRLPAPR
jgi:hypothetical protein